jgi:hypothetical protein
LIHSDHSRCLPFFFSVFPPCFGQRCAALFPAI